MQKVSPWCTNIIYIGATFCFDFIEQCALTWGDFLKIQIFRFNPCCRKKLKFTGEKPENFQW